MEAVKGSCPWTWTAAWEDKQNYRQIQLRVSCWSDVKQRVPVACQPEPEPCVAAGCGLLLHTCTEGHCAQELGQLRGPGEGPQTEWLQRNYIYLHPQKKKNCPASWVFVKWLTDSLGGHHAGHLGGRTHGAERLRTWWWRPHSSWHTLEVCAQKQGVANNPFPTCSINVRF